MSIDRSLDRAFEQDRSPRQAQSERSPLAFFLLAIGLAIPFYVLSAVVDVQLIPGVPVGALAFVCPATAAAILSYREHGAAGAARLLRRSIDILRIRAKAWLVPVFLLAPAVTTGAYLLTQWRGSPVPDPHLALLYTLIMAVVWYVAALGEELGWSGYAIDPMQRRWGAVPAAVVLGLFWWAVHVPLMVALGQSPIWIAVGIVDCVGMRVIMTWLYNNTGRSVFAVTVFHALLNLSAHALFPAGIFYETEQNRTLLIVLVAVLVIAGWGARTLTRTAAVELTPLA